MLRWVGWGTLFLCIVFSLRVSAQVLIQDSGLRFARTFPTKLSLKQRINLDKVRPEELFAVLGRNAVDEGVWTGFGAFDFRNPNLILRSLDRLWRYRMPLAGMGDPLLAIDVSYSIEGANGSAEVLSQIDDPTNEIDVVLQPHPVTLVASTSKQVIMEGGISLLLDLKRVRISGDYEGTLTVTVNQF